MVNVKSQNSDKVEEKKRFLFLLLGGWVVNSFITVSPSLPLAVVPGLGLVPWK